MTGQFIDLHCDTLDRIALSKGTAGLRDGNHDINLVKMQQGGGMMQFFAIWTRMYKYLQKIMYY